MALFVRNQTNRTVLVALGYHYPNCPDGDNWGKKGWWRDRAGRDCHRARRCFQRGEVLLSRA